MGQAGCLSVPGELCESYWVGICRVKVTGTVNIYFSLLYSSLGSYLKSFIMFWACDLLLEDSELFFVVSGLVPISL